MKQEVRKELTCQLSFHFCWRFSSLQRYDAAKNYRIYTDWFSICPNK